MRACVAVAAVLAIVAGTVDYALARPTGGARTATWNAGRAPRPVQGVATPPTAARTPAASAAPDAPGDLVLRAGTWSAWALLDRRTGAIRGSGNLTETNNTESMVKVWIAADDLRRFDQAHSEPGAAERATLSRMIRDSDDAAAQAVYRRNGSDEVIRRLIAVCGLTDTSVYHQWWSLTQMSPRDAVRMGACVADGRAAGRRWTPWLLNEMRHVRGEGRFGVVDALTADGAAGLAIKNGWTLHNAEQRWNINCLAVADRWILAVEVRFPASDGGLRYGASICTDVARRTVTSTSPRRPG